MLHQARDTDGFASLKAETEGHFFKQIFRRISITGPELCAQAFRYESALTWLGITALFTSRRSCTFVSPSASSSASVLRRLVSSLSNFGSQKKNLDCRFLQFGTVLNNELLPMVLWWVAAATVWSAPVPVENFCWVVELGSPYN